MGNHEKQRIKSLCGNKLAIEYGSDVLLGLQYRGVGDQSFNLETAATGSCREIQLVVLKNRNGPIQEKIDYEYYPMFNNFIEQAKA